MNHAMRISGAPNTDLALQRLGRTGLYLFAFFALIGPTGAALGKLLMLVALLARPITAWRTLHRDPAVILWVLAGIVLATGAILAHWRFPGYGEAVIDSAVGWWHLFTFWLPAIWIHGNNRRVLYLLGVAVAGLLVSFVYHMGADLGQLVAARRWSYKFALSHVEVGLYVAVTLLGLFLFAARSVDRGSGFWTRAAIAALLIFLLALFAQILVASASRGAWFAFAGGGLPVLLWAALRYARQSPGRVAYSGGMMLGALVLVGVSVAVINADRLVQRLAQEQETVAIVLSQGLSAAPDSSLGYRLRVWSDVGSRWIEHPVLGWGPGSARALISESRDEDIHHLHHVHSGYLQVLVELGLVGVLLIGSALWLSFRSIRRAARDSACPSDIYLFVVGAYLITLIWSITSFQAVHVPWRNFWLLLLSVGYGYRFIAPSGASPLQRSRNGR